MSLLELIVRPVMAPCGALPDHYNTTSCSCRRFLHHVLLDKPRRWSYSHAIPRPMIVAHMADYCDYGVYACDGVTAQVCLPVGSSLKSVVQASGWAGMCFLPLQKKQRREMRSRQLRIHDMHTVFGWAESSRLHCLLTQYTRVLRRCEHGANQRR